MKMMKIDQDVVVGVIYDVGTKDEGRSVWEKALDSWVDMTE